MPPPHASVADLSLELALDLLLPTLIVWAEAEANDLERAAWRRLVEEVERNRAADQAAREAFLAAKYGGR